MSCFCIGAETAWRLRIEAYVSVSGTPDSTDMGGGGIVQSHSMEKVTDPCISMI
jgi:hypothetical protein